MTRKLLDLTGDRYGRLVVLRESEKKSGKRYWLCKCDCGEEKAIQMSALRNGTTQSCGCLRNERASETSTQDLSGRYFSRLLVIKIVGKVEDKLVNIWRCKCDCGEFANVRTDHLNSGAVKSCGCLKEEQNEKNLFDARLDKYVDGVSTLHLKAKLRDDNKSGHKGVGWARREAKWRAYIRVKNKEIHLGYHVDIKDAIAARKAGEDKYHKPYIDSLKEQENYK